MKKERVAINLGEYTERIKTHCTKIAEILHWLELDRQDATTILQEQAFFLGRHIRLSELKDADFERVRRTFVIARLCEQLTDDEGVEQALQMRRLQSNEFWNRFDVLEWEFPAKKPEDLRNIERDTQAWLERLQIEFKQRNSKSSRSQEANREVRLRKEESLPADASTLARLIWASHEAGSNRRVVFVTGDRVMLNAYRRWYVEGDGIDGSTYMMRPLALYAPHYNLREAGATLSPEIEAFEQTRQALEAWTYPLTFALKQHYYAKKPTLRYAGALARDRFCMEVEAGDPDTAFLNDYLQLADNLDHLKVRNQQLDGMADGMRWLERLAIGTLPQLVLDRGQAAIANAGDFTAALEKAQSSDERSGNDVLELWLQDRLSEVMSSGFEFSLPFAVEWLERFARDIPNSTETRLRTPLRIDLPLRGEFVPASAWVLRFGSDTNPIDTLRELTRQPSRLFALASWVARERNMWTEAIRFADFASRCHDLKIRGPDEPLAADADISHECSYLKAVSLRIRMASDPPATKSDADLWRRDLEGAEAALSYCIHDPPGDLRKARAISERASVRLTYCAWAAVGDLGALAPYAVDRLDLRGIFAGAIGDLTLCAAALNDLHAKWVDSADEERKKTLNWVELQTVLGAECGRLLYERLFETIDPHHGEGYLPRMPRALAALDTVARCVKVQINNEEHFILRGYDLSAQSRVEPDRDKRQRLYSSIHGLRAKADALALDVEMLEAIKAAALVRAALDAT